MQRELYVSGLFTLSSLPVLKGTQKEQRWQHVNYNDLTCHVAVYLRGPQGTTPIRINGVEARGAANQLVGLTRWLVDGWKKRSGDRNQLFLRESAHPSDSFLLPDSSDCTTSLFMNFLWVVVFLMTYGSVYYIELLLWCRWWYNKHSYFDITVL